MGKPAGAGYDVFVSYARADVDRVRSLWQALDAVGLNAYVDENSVEVHDSISASISAGLAHSKVLLAYYSRAYPSRPYCQQELIEAFLAAQHAGEVNQRILVVNPEPDGDHIEPVELRDARWRDVPETAKERRQFAADVASAVARLQQPIGALRPPRRPARWWSSYPVGKAPFLGRYAELWRVHSALTVDRFPFAEHAPRHGTAIVHGLGGVGKTALARHYAVTFGTAYPGGVAHLAAHCGEEANIAVTGSGQRGRATGLLANYRAQVQAVAQRAKIPLGEAPADQLLDVLGMELTRRDEPWLWLIDDVPAGLPLEIVRQLLVPSPCVRTVLTSRDARYAELGVSVPVDGMLVDEALLLLQGTYQPAEEDEARALAAALAGHPLALELAAAELRKGRGLSSVSAYRQRVQAEVVDLRVKAVVGDAARGLKPIAMALLGIAGVLAAAPVPVRLLAAALRTLLDVAPEEALRMTAEALDELEERCIIRRSDTHIVAHAVVLRALPATNDAQLLPAVASALSNLLDKTPDTAFHEPIAVHAQHLAADRALPEPLTTRLLAWLAAAAARAGELRSAGDLGERLVELLLQSGEPTDGRVGLAAAAAARAYLDAGVYDRALPLARLGAEMAQGGHDTNGERTRAQHVLAQSLDALGRFADADPHWTAAEAGLSGLEPATAAAVSVDRARALRLRGRLSEARAVLASLDVEGELLASHVEMAALDNLRGRPLAAKRAAERAVNGYRERGMEHHPAFLEASLALLDANFAIIARTPYGIGGWRPERRVLDELRDLRDAYADRYGTASPLAIAANINYGTQMARWTAGQAQDILVAAAEAARQALGEQHPYRLRARYGLSHVAMLSSRYPEALEAATEAYDGQRRVLGENHPETLFSQLQAGVARRLVHDDEIAAELIRQATNRMTRTLGITHDEVWRAWVCRLSLHVPAPVVRSGLAVVRRIPL
jgi:hypothetical protein